MMGTLVEISVVGNPDMAKVTAHELFKEIQHIDDLASFHKPSALMQINEHAGKGPFKADPELLRLIEEALRIAQQTNGAFDPTIGPVSVLWQFSGDQEPRLPSESEIKEALTKVGWQRVKIDKDAGTILLPEPGMALDLGGITKGYALNRAADMLKKSKVSGALVNIGGDILAYGEKEPGKPWRVGVEDPRDKSSVAAVTELKDKLIVTSGDYERFFIKDGKRYHHILDPATGYPASTLRSVTVVGPIGTTLQPLGTATFVMGADKGLKFVKTIQGAAGLLIDAEGRFLFTDGARSVFTVKTKE
jgi:thiamine biosynthesis lipoprotein